LAADNQRANAPHSRCSFTVLSLFSTKFSTKIPRLKIDLNIKESIFPVLVFSMFSDELKHSVRVRVGQVLSFVP
jgi:hypothetical protein